MSLFDDVFFMGVGAVSEIKKRAEDLLNKGKISQEEAQRMFEDLKEGEQLKEQLSPLSLSLGFSMYMKKRLNELLDDLKQSGKISTEEAKKYYEKYIPEDLQKKFKETKDEVMNEDDYVKKEDFNKMFEKLEKIEAKLKEKEE
ncbi:MAG TPA: hypothetical protein PLV00_06570 [Caldisericia bacterium]|nr:hypothetical protein [Caldisericia bacterium]HRW33668.1 hypothetical protein [Thermotogota bacterium]